jgi:hypothetical protein
MKLDYEAAKRLLVLHGPGTFDTSVQPQFLETGFLGSLRPYKGLQEQNFHQVMEALFTVGQSIHASPQLDRELVHAIWHICSTTRLQGLTPKGLLQRNKLIAQDDVARLDRWIEIIENTTLGFLQGLPAHYLVHRYSSYVHEYGWWENIDFFISLLIQAISDPDLGDSIEMDLEALTKLGPKAAAALPALYQAEQRKYTWYVPEERCTEEVRKLIRSAIVAIEKSNRSS